MFDDNYGKYPGKNAIKFINSTMEFILPSSGRLVISLLLHLSRMTDNTNPISNNPERDLG